MFDSNTLERSPQLHEKRRDRRVRSFVIIKKKKKKKTEKNLNF